MGDACSAHFGFDIDLSEHLKQGKEAAETFARIQRMKQDEEPRDKMIRYRSYLSDLEITREKMLLRGEGYRFVCAAESRGT
jgi:hypothetical protein